MPNAYLGPPRRNQGIDHLLLGAVLCLMVIGLIAVYTASSERSADLYGSPHEIFIRHISRTIMGIAIMLAVSWIPYRFWQKLSGPAVVMAFVLLLLVFIEPFGVSSHNATRWIRLGPLQFQPSEFAKFALILFLASWAYQRGSRMKLFVPGIGVPIMVTITLILPIFLQPDFSTAALITLVALVIIFLAGAHIGYLAACIGPIAIVAGIAVWASPYKRARLLTYLAPNADQNEAGYQILQSWIGLGRGGMFGVGIGESRQKLFFLPDAHTDFIYSVIGEELGFIGTTFVLALFILLVWRGFRVAHRCPDPFGGYLAAGITFVIGMYALINMGIATGVLPTTGLPLPFISYGGTSLLFTFAAMGIVLNISQYGWPKMQTQVNGVYQ